MIETELTQTEIANALDVSQPTVSNWLLMKTNPQGLQRKALKKHFPGLLKEIDHEWEKIDSKTLESQ